MGWVTSFLGNIGIGGGVNPLGNGSELEELKDVEEVGGNTDNDLIILIIAIVALGGLAWFFLSQDGNNKKQKGK